MAHLGGHTTKQTYVTTYTTDIDPRMLPDFVTRGAVPAEGWRGDETTGERQTSAKYASQPPCGQERHHHPPRHPYNPRPPHHGGAPPYDHGYRQQPPASHHDEYGCSEASASTSSATTSATSSASRADNGSSHRLRKKYTTTTVTTITTTTILLPKVQEAYVFPSVTSHHTDQQQNVGGAGGPYAITGGGTREYVQPPQGCLYEVGNGSDNSGRIQEANFPAGNRVVPSKMQPALSGEGSQNWEFRQHTKNQVETEEARGRLPTLQDLGIASYFAKDSTGNGSAVPRRREAPYAPAPHNPSNGAAPLRQQPWVAAETRYEVEGGKRYC
ncbi:hypothetical_protein [Leishmania infantum]|uniref:Hypothetical_protein n=1 Tax=Leishmania infantum TaxID=5671 RepID=A0A6L0X727_LEIIN|nr:hypothetical_protein [Leishmania infantum]SUZ40692.1 hypothetical_protein [Leishmania infantum]